ncbi:hypothetical protein RI065_00060 [Mycoplasmatota bacterium zrk1]
MGIFESIFDVSYLLSVIIISAIILKRGLKSNKRHLVLFGVMGLLLGFGDAFHLIPRIIAHITTGMADYQSYLGVGKLITSITMTIFYLLIYYVYEDLKGENKKAKYFIYAMMLIRFGLLALPGNQWVTNDGALFYGILRNIPFAIMGGLIVYLFYQVQEPAVFKKFGLWIIVSFVCYFIVVVGASFVPVLGAFMIPKTVAYFIVVYLGYRYL